MKRLLSYLFIALVLLPHVSYGAISYDVVNAPQMFLDESITTTQTTGIKLSAPTRNGETVTFPTTTGAVLRIRSGSKVEDIRYESATVNQTTKVVTLVSVTRNLCWNIVGLHVSCGNGQQFSKGSTVELNIDARLLNKKANVDRANTFVYLQTFASGAVISGTRYPLKLSEFTTDQRNALTPEEGMMLKNTTTGTMNMYVGGAWVAIGSSTTENAGNFTAGKVQLIGTNTGALLNRTMTGSTGPFVLSPSITKWTSSGSTDHGKLPLLDQSGRIPSGFLLNQVKKSSYYTATSGEQVLMDAGGGSQTINLPVSPKKGDRVGVLLTNTGSSKATVLIRGSGTALNILDRWNTSGGVLLYEKGDYAEFTNSGSTAWFLSNDLRIAHRASLRRVAAQTISNASRTKIFFDTTDYDIGKIVDTGTGGRITIRRPGQYLISVSGSFDVGDAQDVEVSIFKNGVLTRASGVYASGAGQSLFASGTFTLPLVTGDYIEMKLRQASGSAGATPTATHSQSVLSVTEILR